MNIIKKCFMPSVLALFLYTMTNTAVTAVTQTDALHPIDGTLTHLDAALKAVNANDWEIAQEHMKGGRQCYRKRPQTGSER